MNIVFLSLSDFDIEKHSIYADLLRYFQEKGHKIFVLSAVQRRFNRETGVEMQGDVTVLKVKTGNITKTNVIEKGISTLLIESQFKKAAKKFWKDVHFDLVLYPTPPITFNGVVSFLKKRDGAKSYLLLKDIFPQNAVDIGMMKKSGVKGLLYRMFRRKEKKLYAVSDFIGCMSQANVDYVLRHNPEIPSEKVEICPNTIDVLDVSATSEEKLTIREKYGVPTDKKVFVYGGNLGRPQGIPFLMEALRAVKEHPEAYFLVVGGGTEYKKLEAFFREENPVNAKLLQKLPKEDYDLLVSACDVGLIFLNHRFTIPNFPSRLLAYLQARLPTLACTDPNTDVGKVICEGGFGFWCESNDAEAFRAQVDAACKADLPTMGKRGYDYLCENYTSRNAYDIIMKRISEGK